MTKKDINDLIHDLQIRKEALEVTCSQHRDDMNEASGAIGEIDLMIWALEKKLG